MDTIANAPPLTPHAVKPGAAPVGRGGTFHELLSELNPLQYIPVVGTVYRALTGDVIPEAARVAGSLVVSGLAGGPVGVATSVALLAAEKATGVDPEKIGQSVLADVGIGASSPPAAAGTHVAAPAAAPVSSGVGKAGWSDAQLAAQGVTVSADGNLSRGALRGSDVLNDMELARLAG